MPFSLIRSVARIHEFYLRRLTGFLYLFKLDQVLGNFIINHQFNKIKKYFTLTFVKK